MAKYRETPCKHYVCKGQCDLNKEADHVHLCQHCKRYVPRIKERHLNMKKQKLREIRSKEYKYL